MSTYRRYGGQSPSGKPFVQGALRRLARLVLTSARGVFPAKRPAGAATVFRGDAHGVPTAGPIPLHRHFDQPVPAHRGEVRRTWWAPPFLRRSPSPAVAGERYKIDPQFVPRALERLT